MDATRRTALHRSKRIVLLKPTGRLQTWSRQIYGPRQFHDPGSFTPLLLLMRPVGGGGYTVKKKLRSLLFLCVHLNIKIILEYQIICTTD